MSAKIGPPLLEQHDDSNLPHCKILLVALVFVSRYKNVKASAFGGIEQIAVLISAPTFARGRADRYGPRETERAVQASPDRIEPALGDILGGSIKASRDKLENGFDLRAVKSLEPL
jgi:hypothetical protein